MVIASFFYPSFGKFFKRNNIPYNFYLFIRLYIFCGVLNNIQLRMSSSIHDSIKIIIILKSF